MRTIALIFIFNFCLDLHAQNTIGLPEIINYPKQVYNAGSQNWDIKQDHNGIIYFGNNEGLLSFDGTFWRLYPLPNHTIVRSIEIGDDNKIYVGGQNEFGYFAPDKNSDLQYHSLLGLVPKQERSFDDIWNICTYKNDLFFRSNRKIFQLSNNTLVSFPTQTEWRFIGSSNDVLLAEDLKKGLVIFKNGVWEPFLTDNPLPANALITSFIALNKDTSILATLKDGIYYYTHNKLTPFHTLYLDKLAQKVIYKVILLNNNDIAVATTFDGCHIINRKGNLIQTITHTEGIQNNNIRSIFLDKNKSLWLGLESGIDFIAYNNAVKHIYPEFQNIGSGFSTLIHNNSLYLGTSNGLYKVSMDDIQNLSYLRKPLNLVPNSAGQVWNISQVNGQLIMSHHEGAFIIQNNGAKVLANNTGYWTFLPCSNVLPSPLIVAGNYLGLTFFNYQNGLIQKANIEAPFESSRFVLMDNGGNVWVAHPYKGIYRVTLHQNESPTIKLYTHKNGLFSANNNFIYKIKNRIVVASENGLYEYNEDKDAFESSSYFGNIFKNTSIRYLKEDQNGNIWFIHEKNLGVVDYSEAEPKIIYFPELNDKVVSGFENIYPYNKNNIFIGGEKGFYHVDYEQYKRNRYPFNVQIRGVHAIGKTDSLLYGGFIGEANKNLVTSFSYKFNSIHFEYSAILYGQQANIEYSYFLKGFDKAWSNWSKKAEKDYTNLPEGNYTFQLKARTNLGNESTITSYSFTVLAPWYRTIWAYFVYICILAVFVFYLYNRQHKKFLLQSKKHEEEQKRLLYLHQLEIEKNEKEIVKLKNEKLESEIVFKNSELANSAMHLVQKREIITRIREDLMKLMKKVDNEKVTEEFKKVIKMLGEDNRIDDSWEHFAHHFDKVHSDFLIDLKKQIPGLTANDLKLCAYLRMNLSSKEIAQLMNISLRGVEISRYRLRKKLNLPTEVSLFDYLLSISKVDKQNEFSEN